MKKLVYSLLIILPIFILSGCKNSEQSNTSDGRNFEVSRTSIVSNEQNPNNSISENDKNTENPKNESNDTEENKPVETTLYEFSTPIKSKSSNRLQNIQVTCGFLNGATVNNGEEFSFCNTVGQVSSDKGYKKADVIINSKVQQALGGGMCQVSTTLYNAALGVSGIEITERHPHAKPVDYIEQGKDATISYGTLDLKFKNNTGNTIKIYATGDNGVVNVKIVSVT